MNEVRRPSFPELIDWIDGRLPERRAEEITTCVANDARLRRDVAWIERFLHTARHAPLVLPPDELRASLRAMYRDRVASRTDLPTRLTLLFDSRRDSILTGVRAIDGGTSIQLAFSGTSADLVLDVHHRPDGTARVTGQLFVAEPHPGRAEVAVHSRNGTILRASGTDELGRFAVDGVPAGPTEFRVRGATIEVVVDADLSARRETT